jgi:hypothetical protein
MLFDDKDTTKIFKYLQIVHVNDVFSLEDNIDKVRKSNLLTILDLFSPIFFGHFSPYDGHL